MATAATKTALVVGGTNGIGKGIAQRLAALGVKVVLVGRDKDKTAAVAADVGASEWLLVDVCKQADVRRLADEVRSKYTHLDYLVVSAGALNDERKLSQDGVEWLLALNYLWRFQLIGLLKDLLAAAPEGARVLAVATSGSNSDVFFDDPNFEHSSWTMLKAARQAHQLHDVFTVEAQRRWGALGNGIQFHVTYPGWVRSKEASDITVGGLAGFILKNPISMYLRKSIEVTALQHVPLLLEPVGAHGGKLWNAVQSGGPVKEIVPASRVVDPEYGAKCWQLSESLVKPEYK